MRSASSGSGIEVAVGILKQLVQYLNGIHADVRAIFASAGVDAAVLDRPDERIPFETYIALEDEAAKAVGDPCFGLHMGEYVAPGNWSILGYMMMNCRTLTEAFGKSARYSRVVGNLIGSSLRIGFRKVTAVLTVPKNAPAMSHHCFESVLASSVTMMRTLTGRDVSPVEVGFRYLAPENPGEYKRVFRCPVSFGCSNTFITLDTGIMKTPVLAPDPTLLEYFENYARTFLSDVEEGKLISRAVSRLILELLDGGSFSLFLISKELGMSGRTLQQKLKAEGNSFKELVRETREHLAKQYLGENQSVEDITYLLGFEDTAAFRKAFKLWTGMTPGAYRRRVRT